jgi:hypothetical protein
MLFAAYAENISGNAASDWLRAKYFPGANLTVEPHPFPDTGDMTSISQWTFGDLNLSVYSIRVEGTWIAAGNLWSVWLHCAWISFTGAFQPFFQT